jgi:hypothetical protein
VDNANPPAKILVDEIRTEIKVTSAAVDEIADNAPPMPPTPLHYKSTAAPTPNQNPTKPDVSRTLAPHASAGVANPIYATAEAAPAYITPSLSSEGDLDNMPPPPDNFPDGWDMEWQPSFDEVAMASKPEPKFKKNEPVTPPLVTRAVPALTPVEETDQAEERREAVVQSMYVPLVKENKDREHPPQQLTVTLRSTGDHERDKRRIKTLHGILTSHHGRDKFSFHIFEDNKGYLIDFPNDTTRIRPELLAQLKKLIGEESWRVEEITFQ